MKTIFQQLSDSIPTHKPTRLPWAIWLLACIIHCVGHAGIKPGIELWKRWYAPVFFKRLLLID